MADSEDGFSVGICICIASIIVALVFLLPPLKTDCHRQTPWRRSFYSLKQIGLAFQLYMDYPDELSLPNRDHAEAWNLLYRTEAMTDLKVYSPYNPAKSYPLQEENNDYLFFGSMNIRADEAGADDVIVFHKPMLLPEDNTIPALYGDGHVDSVPVTEKTAEAVVRSACKGRFNTPYRRALLEKAREWDAAQKGKGR